MGKDERQGQRSTHVQVRGGSREGWECEEGGSGGGGRE